MIRLSCNFSFYFQTELLHIFRRNACVYRAPRSSAGEKFEAASWCNPIAAVIYSERAIWIKPFVHAALRVCIWMARAVEELLEDAYITRWRVIYWTCIYSREWERSSECLLTKGENCFEIEQGICQQKYRSVVEKVFDDHDVQEGNKLDGCVHRRL